MKTATPHITFLGKLGIGLLRDYLETRGLLDSADRLFPISKTAVERFFVRRAQNLSEGYEGRVRCGPHTLRTAFRTLMVDAGCPETYAEFFMGHNLTSDIKKVYTSKTRDGWRTEYAKYEKAVTFSLDGGKQNMPQSAKTLGYDSASEYPFSLIKLDKKENVKGNLL